MGLSQRLSVVFAVLLLACCGASAWLQMAASERHEQEVTQRLSQRPGGAHRRQHGADASATASTQAAVRDLFDKLMAVNPSVEVYLLDTDGRIAAQAAPPGHLKRDRVDLAPVRRLLAGAAAADPRRRPAQRRCARKVFSAAPMKVDGRDAGYVYVVLSGEEREALAANVAASSVLRTTLWSMALVALLGLMAGLAAFRLITRPLRELTGRGAAVRERRRRRAGAAPRRRSTGWRSRQRRDRDARARPFAQMTQRIAEQWRELTAQDQQRRELFANISHDLRTPLDLAARLPGNPADEGRHARRRPSVAAIWTSRWARAARSGAWRRSCSNWRGWNTAWSSPRRRASRWPTWCRTSSRSSNWPPRRGASGWCRTSRRACRS